MSKYIIRNNCTNKLIQILQTLHSNESVQQIYTKLNNCQHGTKIEDIEVEAIFKPMAEDWSIISGDCDNPYWCVKAICGLIKRNMFH